MPETSGFPPGQPVLAVDLEEALAIHRDLGHRLGQANARGLYRTSARVILAGPAHRSRCLAPGRR